MRKARQRKAYNRISEKASHVESHAEHAIDRLKRRRKKRWDKIGDNHEKYGFVSSVSSCLGRSQVGTKTKVYRLPDSNGRIISFATKRIKTDRIRGIKQSDVHIVHTTIQDEEKTLPPVPVSVIVGMTLQDIPHNAGERGRDWFYASILKSSSRRQIVVPRTKRIEQLADCLANIFETKR